MASYCYIIKATQSDNVGTIDAANEAEALAKLEDIYTPDVKGRAHANIKVEIISSEEFVANKTRIEAERKAEAEMTHDDILTQESEL